MNGPVIPVTGKPGFFSNMLSNSPAGAMNAYILEQKKAGKSPQSVNWGAVSDDELKDAYQRKYGKPYPG